MQSPSLDTDVHHCTLQSFKPPMNTSSTYYPQEEIPQHRRHHIPTRISSASTLYDSLQHLDSIKSCDYIPYHKPSLSELPSPNLACAPQFNLDTVERWAGSTHKRRNSELDIQILGPAAWGQSRPDKAVKRRRLRSCSLDGGLSLYSFWDPESFQRGAAVLLDTDITETNSQDTASLWNIVSMESKEEGKGGGVMTRAGSKEKSSRTGQSSTSGTFERESNLANKKRKAPTIDDASLPLKSQVAAPDPKRISPYNTGFDEQILAPRSIKVTTHEYHMKASSHFGVTELSSTASRRQHYTEVRNVKHSTVWIESDDATVGAIVKEYLLMRVRKVCEAAFATYGKDALLKQDAFLRNDRDEDDRSWMTERMVELVAKPKPSSRWEPPPLVAEPGSAIDLSSSVYAFDLRPDCSYWLSLMAFNPDYRQQIDNYVYVMYGELTCPYFTIEFKKDSHTEARAISQVAAAASVALYNRYRLRRTSLKTQKKSWTRKLTRVLRHYGLTMQGDEYTVWQMQPILSEFQWTGCEMKAVGHGFCTTSHGVRGLIDWINEIHCWGLTSHGPRCAKDVKYTMQAVAKKTGFRPSDVRADSEDGSDSEEEGEESE